MTTENGQVGMVVAITRDVIAIDVVDVGFDSPMAGSGTFPHDPGAAEVLRVSAIAALAVGATVRRCGFRSNMRSPDDRGPGGHERGRAPAPPRPGPESRPRSRSATPRPRVATDSLRVSCRTARAGKPASLAPSAHGGLQFESLPTHPGPSDADAHPGPGGFDGPPAPAYTPAAYRQVSRTREERARGARRDAPAPLGIAHGERNEVSCPRR